MSESKQIRVAVNGYGVIGKRVAAAVASQSDMSLAGVSDVVTDWRAHMVVRNGFRLFGATGEHATAMRDARLDVAGTLEELLGQADVVVDDPFDAIFTTAAPRSRPPASSTCRADIATHPPLVGTKLDPFAFYRKDRWLGELILAAPSLSHSTPTSSRTPLAWSHQVLWPLLLHR